MVFIDIDFNSCNHLNKSRAFSENSTVSHHMQETQFLNKNIYLYQRRRHKLFRALTEADSENQHQHCSPRQQLIKLYETAVNKENQISQIGYFVKHQLTCSLNMYSESLVRMIWSLINQRDGGIVAFLIYRICRKYPSLFWKLFVLINSDLQASLQNKQQNKQIIIMHTDLFLYGFPFTIQDFQARIFPHFKQCTIDLIVKYQQILTCNIFFSLKLQKIFNSSFNEWIEQEKSRIIQSYEKLSTTATNIQEKIIHQQENETQSSIYELELQKFETELYHFLNAANKMQCDFNALDYKLKTIFQLKKECRTFKYNFGLSYYESSLYQQKGTDLANLKPLKKHEMIKIQQNDAFINQMKLCSDLKQCLNLSGYFIEQMNIQNNREYLVETIINGCYNYNNISYVLKILAQISQIQPTLLDYCSTKAKKICSSAGMNTKYQKILCQMTKYRLFDEKILIQYCEKILKHQNNQTVKQVQSILQNMGGIVYYRSLPTHIRINNLFDRLQTIIKTKLTYFSIENLYQLKGLINYLRNKKKSSNAQNNQIARIQIKAEENYNFLLTKMGKMMKEGQQNKVLDYFIFGIDQQQYLTSYFYASLLKGLNSTEMQHKVHKQTLQIIKISVSDLIAQKAVKWSRFLGQLYNYQCIGRKQLFQNFKQILIQGNSQDLISVAIKCICSSLQTSKSYLNINNLKKERQIFLMLLQLKIFYVKYKKYLQYALICEVQEILEFFNPQLLMTLQKEQEIRQFIILCTQFIVNTNNPISYYLSQLVKGVHLQNLRPDQKDNRESKSRQKQKDSPEKVERKWVQKQQRTVIFVQKIEKSEKQVKMIPDFYQKDKQSSVSGETVEGTTVPKKIRVMGRSKKDNKIKTVTCVYSQAPSQN